MYVEFDRESFAKANVDIDFDEITEACEFFAKQLMHGNLARNLYLTIDLDPELDAQAWCAAQDDEHREFSLTLRLAEGDDPAIKSIAHEMVHVKQYAKGELSDAITMRGGSIVTTAIWQGQAWHPKKKTEDEYYDSPWEIEAYGREVGLWRKWLSHKET